MTQPTGTPGSARPGRPVVPPVLYAPCTGPIQDGEVTLQFRRMRDGRLALLLYTALDRLVDCCGEHQPWVALPAERLDEVDAAHPYDVILLDLEVPDDLREASVEA